MALKASQDDQARLLALQALDTRLRQLEHRGKNLTQHAELLRLSAAAERIRVQQTSQLGAVEDARTELNRIESDVAVVEARISRDSQRLQASSSVKDVAGLESELTGLRRRLDELEDVQLAVMDRLELLENDARITTAERDELLGRVTDAEHARDAAAAEVDAERVGAEADRAAIAAGLPADLVALYERQRARYGFGASLLRGGISSASGVKLLENELAVVRAAAADDVLICPDSQAILVRTDESGL